MNALRISTVAALLLILAGCSDVPERNNGTANNQENNSNNNNSNNTTNNGIVGQDCTTNEDCDPPAASCLGNVATSYTGQGLCSSEFHICNFSFVQESQDCSTSQQSCEAGACVDNACTGIECPAPVDSCVGNILHFYNDDGVCDLETAACVFNEFTLDCVEEGGECIDRTCVGPCVGVECLTPPADFCTANVATQYATEGTCLTADGSCEYTSTNEVDCEATQEICVAGACVADPCENVDCTQPADKCDMNMTYVYSGDGVCVAGVCDYSAVETIVDCGTDYCLNAACVTTVPAAGELVITEIMHSPVAVDGTLGEWFEITNASAKPLELEGLILGSAGDVGYTLAFGQSTQLASGAYYVFGINADMVTNGGISVDSAYTDIVLDAVDDLSLMAGAVVVDSVVWDGTWPATAGSAMQFGSNYDWVADDNALVTNWCDATDVLASTDLGTPGAANGTCN